MAGEDSVGTIENPKVKFYASDTNTQKQQDYLKSMSDPNKITDMVKKRVDQLKGNMFMENARERPLTEPEESNVKQSLLVAQELLDSLDMRDGEALLPKPENIQFIVYTRKPTTNINVAYKGRYFRQGDGIIIEAPDDADLFTDPGKLVLYHELGHAVVKQVVEIGDNEQEPSLWQDGFDKSIRDNTRYRAGRYQHRDIYGESLANLFSLLCLDKENVDSEVGPYPLPTAFMSSFLIKFSEGLNISPLEGLKQMLKAHISRDFSFQRKVVDTFGTDFARKLNRLSGTTWETRDSLNVLDGLAEEGGFVENFRGLLRSGEGIEYPGIKTKMKWPKIESGNDLLIEYINRHP